MRIRIVLIPIIAVAGSFVLAETITAAPQQQNQSVAEAARKARARKKTPVKPARVLTDDDLLPTAQQPRDPSAVITTNQRTPPEAIAPGDQAADSQKDAKAEKYWRQRFGEAYNKLHLAEADLDVLNREWNKGQVEYYSDPQKALKEQYTRKDINEHQQKIEAKKKEIAQLRQTIANLEDELRKVGGDAGWARQP